MAMNSPSGSESRRRDQHQAVQEVRWSMGRQDRPTRLGRGAPLRVGFFTNQSGQHPMASLMSTTRGSGGGGRGGQTRLSLLLSLIWVASGGDHSTTRPASFWARLLGLADPSDSGARVVSSSWAELQTRGFVNITQGRFSGDVPTITLLNEAGGVPSREYTVPLGREGDLYIRVPEEFWGRGLISDEELTGPGLVMYLAALRTHQLARDPDALTFPAATFKERYGVSETTRKKGLRNLSDELGILHKRFASVDDAGGVGHRLRPRSVYQIAPQWAPHAATPTPAQP